MKRIAIYPGSFDPCTNGHLDIITRSAGIFDEVIVAIAENYSKNHSFLPSERIDMMKEIIKDFDNVRIETFTGLLANYAELQGAKVIVRGLRALSDFEYEFQMALTNMKLNRNVETLFLVTRAENAYLSSSMVKEVYRLGGNVTDLVPEVVMKYLKNKREE